MSNQICEKKIEALTVQLDSLVSLMSVISVKESIPNRYIFMTGGFFDTSSEKKEIQKRNLMFLSTARNLLNEYGIRESNKGYVYIIDAVRVILQLGTLDIRLNTDIYPIVACDFGISRGSVIEHAIRNAIAAAYRDYERKKDSNLMKHFHKRPSNKVFLFHIADMICQKMNLIS
ncbi:MAG TPA: hypothetical protein GX736_04690 [Mogibacterium sp.]|nr:hypothetical protein [Mogibacterium sp.]